MKACSKCGDEKPSTDFYKHEGAPDGRRGDCKACVLTARRLRYERDGDTLRSRVRAYQAANPKRVAESRRAYGQSLTPEGRVKRNRRAQLAKYGLTPETYDTLFVSQGECCAICQSPEPGRYWTVDHDHSTGATRGILCWHCNVALGHFRDDVSSLIAAADYVMRSRLSSTEKAG